MSSEGSFRIDKDKLWSALPKLIAALGIAASAGWTAAATVSRLDSVVSDVAAMKDTAEQSNRALGALAADVKMMRADLDGAWLIRDQAIFMAEFQRLNPDIPMPSLGHAGDYHTNGTERRK